MIEYPKEQLWELYQELPKEIQETIFSESTADKIHSICTRNKIEDTEKISKIAKLSGYVLLGLLLPEELEGSFISEIKIKKEEAKQISKEINRFIFLPIKDSIEALYGVKITPKVNEEKNKKTGKDSYREAV